MSAAVDPDAETESLLAALREVGTEERATFERGYLKHDLEHVGAKVPETRKLAKQLLRRLPKTRDALLAQIDALWSRPIFELRRAAAELGKLGVDRLTAGDLPRFERMTREAKTWALLDELAVHVAGPLFAAHPELATELERWAVDDDFWVRRAALLAHLKPLRGGEGDWDRFVRFADGMLEEKELFIRKAIGWVVRDTGRKRPDLVREWLAPRVTSVSGVTLREALKALPDDEAAALKDAHRARR